VHFAHNLTWNQPAENPFTPGTRQRISTAIASITRDTAQSLGRFGLSSRHLPCDSRSTYWVSVRCVQNFESFCIDWCRFEVLSTPHLFSVSFWKCKVLLCSPCKMKWTLASVSSFVGSKFVETIVGYAKERVWLSAEDSQTCACRLDITRKNDARNASRIVQKIARYISVFLLYMSLCFLRVYRTRRNSISTVNRNPRFENVSLVTEE
jgi:hypothetical protein